MNYSKLLSKIKQVVPARFHDQSYILFLRFISGILSKKNKIQTKQLTTLYPAKKFGSITFTGVENQPPSFKKGFETRTIYAPYARTVTLKNAQVFFDSGFILCDGVLYTDSVIEFPQKRDISRFFLHTLSTPMHSLAIPKKIKKAGLYVLPKAVSHNHYHRLIDLYPRLSVFHPTLPLLTNCENLQLLAGHKTYTLNSTSRYLVETLVVPVFEQDLCAGFLPEYLSYTKNALIPKKKSANSLLYISRSDASFRKIKNESQLLIQLEKRGFKAVVLTGMTIKQQAEIFSGASVIVGMHGAGLTNMLFAPVGCRVVEILPQAYVANCYYQLACALSHRYYAIVAKDIATYDIVGKWDVECDVGGVCRLLDDILRC
jgi:hypothetical protein